MTAMDRLRKLKKQLKPEELRDLEIELRNARGWDEIEMHVLKIWEGYIYQRDYFKKRVK